MGLVDELTELNGVVRKGSVVEHQLCLDVSLLLLNCWIVGFHNLLSRSPSSRLILSDNVTKKVHDF